MNIGKNLMFISHLWIDNAVHEILSPQYGFDIDEYIDEYYSFENNINL